MAYEAVVWRSVRTGLAPHLSYPAGLFHLTFDDASHIACGLLSLNDRALSDDPTSRRSFPIPHPALTSSPRFKLRQFAPPHWPCLLTRWCTIAYAC